MNPSQQGCSTWRTFMLDAVKDMVPGVMWLWSIKMSIPVGLVRLQHGAIHGAEARGAPSGPERSLLCKPDCSMGDLTWICKSSKWKSCLIQTPVAVLAQRKGTFHKRSPGHLEVVNGRDLVLGGPRMSWWNTQQPHISCWKSVLESWLQI